MPLQQLSVKLPESVRFPEGVNGEDSVLHLIAWYFYSCGNSDYAVELTGESPVEVEKKLLEFGIPKDWMSRMNPDRIREKAGAVEIVREAGILAEQRVKDGWKEEDFNQDYLRVQKEIAGILKNKENDKRE